MNQRPVLSATLIALCAAAALAQSYSIDWHTVDGGGGASSGGAFSLSGTIGQPDAQTLPVMSGGTFELTGGYWPVATVCTCPGDLTGDGQRDGQDIQLFVTCMLQGGNCACADMDGSNSLNAADVLLLVNGLLAGSSCP